VRASPSLSQLWQPHSRLCQLCRVCEQQRSCSPGFCRKELHATEGAVEVRRARRRLREAAIDERVGLFTPDKDGGTHTSCGRAAVIAARRGTVCGEVGRVPRFPQLTALFCVQKIARPLSRTYFSLSKSLEEYSVQPTRAVAGLKSLHLDPAFSRLKARQRNLRLAYGSLLIPRTTLTWHTKPCR